MKQSKYSEPQILAILRQAEGSVPVAQLCREHGMSNASFCKLRAKYGDRRDHTAQKQKLAA